MQQVICYNYYIGRIILQASVLIPVGHVKGVYNCLAKGNYNTVWLLTPPL